MKKAIFLGFAATLAVTFLALAGTGTHSAFADNGPHVMDDPSTAATTDKCAGCHRIHTGQNEYLLKASGTIYQFCTSCHDGSGANDDVVDGINVADDHTTVQGALRAGGFQNARINTRDSSLSGDPAVTIGVLGSGATVNSRHNVQEVAGTMWGNGALGTSGPGLANVTLECTNCHDPHGNGQFRILRPIPTGSGAATGVNIADWGTVGDDASKQYTTTNYFDMTKTGTPSATDTILVDTSAWCAQCHTRYLATRHSATGADDANSSRANSGDAIFTYRHTSSGLSYNTSGVVSYVTRACETCHATHGSNSTMTGTNPQNTSPSFSSQVPWPGGSAAPDTNIDASRNSLLKMDNRGMCRKCHGLSRVP